MIFKALTSVTVVLCFFANESEPARILGIFPAASISHQVVFRALTLELSRRGHELFVFTPNPVNNSSLENYKEVDMHHTYDLMMNHVENNGESWQKVWYTVTEAFSNAVLAHPEMQRIIAPNSTEKFDLIIIEYLNFEATYAVQNRLKIPMIGIVSLPMLPSGHYAMGNPAALIYAPHVFDPYTDEMDFWLRLYHVYRYVSYMFLYHTENLVRQDKLVKKYFGNDMPHVSELGKEISLVLVNGNPALGYPRPNLPGVIEIGGFYLKITMKGLEKDLKNFLDDATNGFIYFSLGTNAKSEHLPAEKINTLISVFASLPYKVLWKWERDTLPGKPENVFISKWLPQHDVLAHPNIKLFIYQGGLQSTEEAINIGVPLVGIPIFADQEYNVRKIASVKIGKRVNFEPFSGDELRQAIVEVVTDKSYKERILSFREILNDQVIHPMEKAIWWTEYVLRHNGAPHMRPRVRHLAWYQRELLDVLAFIFVIISIIVYTVYKCLRFVIARCRNTAEIKIKTN